MRDTHFNFHSLHRKFLIATGISTIQPGHCETRILIFKAYNGIFNCNWYINHSTRFSDTLILEFPMHILAWFTFTRGLSSCNFNINQDMQHTVFVVLVTNLQKGTSTRDYTHIELFSSFQKIIVLAWISTDQPAFETHTRKKNVWNLLKFEGPWEVLYFGHIFNHSTTIMTTHISIFCPIIYKLKHK